MAYDESNLLSTPEGYATPGQTAAVREYAKALLYGDGQIKNPQHWTQGLSNIVSALVGGADLFGAGRRDRESDLYDANRLPRDLGDKTQSRSSIAAGMVPQMSPEAPNRQGLGVPPRPDSRPATPMKYYPDDEPQVISKGEGGIMPGGGRILGWDPPEPLPPPGAATALPFDGTPANVPPTGDNAPAAIARALAAGGRGAPGMQPPFPSGGVATKAPVNPVTGEPVIPPGLVPHRTPVTREEFVNTMASHRLRPEVGSKVFDMYYGQRQPIQMGMPGGSLLINPTNPNQQMPIYDIGETEVKAGGAEIKQKYQLVPDGKGGLIQKIIPRSDEAPTGGPSAAAPAGRAPAPPSMDDVPGILKYSADEAPGMLGVAPPPVKGNQVAQLPPVLERMVDTMNAKEIAKKQQEHINTKDFDSFDKKYTAVTNAGEDAAKSMPMLELARKVIEDKNFYSGIMADPVINYKRILAQLGSDPNAAAANELFDKITSGAILSDMRATLQGLGQVRVAEIDLLSKAMANRYNSVAANRAVIDLMMRTHKQADFLSSRATDYREGWRWGADGKPYKTTEPPTYAGLSATMKKFIEKMPTLSPEKVQEYENLFKKEGYNSERAKAIKADLENAATGKPAAASVAPIEPPAPTTRRLPTPGGGTIPGGPPEGFTEPVK